ncbi:prepilin-type N-terminal cleavage/methylation domain-containing protein [Deinococcus cellulosilyticus]|uniref:Prepilin-type N-terminal cleavage/methylation domain-containing protein n=1 Tax=Deinococcus cellulosilyticus (strain DSM 18568 / NBRC 106333 / KACC 11606 / 5516J-15) TaxID=1223518 RepID=A0A511MV53_DEIC1|nr:prepilin-type N-terminal cleavage/methylation domain-containing protein [Deinococcus cellulosilyticus]GEM44463.1 hypothetical protein DC3_00980 [Deinococcus cellulosilyticus NBRC 106333 = KACC 11606]
MSRSQATNGFTLLELLVAMALLSILFVSIYQLFSSSLDTSMRSSARADLDTETQKVQQLMLSRIKEADRFLSTTDVTIQDAQTSGATAYLPSPSLTGTQIVIIRVPTKNSASLCDLFAYYVVPSENLSASALPVQRRLNNPTTGAYSLIEARTASSYTCTSSYPALTQLRLLHPSLASDGFVVTPYIDSVKGTQKGISLSLRGYKKAGTSSIYTNTYQARVVARNL